MDISPVNKKIGFSEDTIEELADEIIESKGEKIAELVFSSEKEEISPGDIQKIMSRIVQKTTVSEINLENMFNLFNETDVDCANIFCKTFPNYFDVNAKDYVFPTDLKEKRAVMNICMLADAHIFQTPKFEQLSLEEIFELLPEQLLKNEKSNDLFEDLHFVKHLNQQKSSEDFLNLVDKILSCGAWASNGLAKNISHLDLSKLDLKEKILLYNKIENSNAKVVFAHEDVFSDQLPIAQVIKELKEIEDPKELVLQLRDLISISDSWAGYFLISAVAKDSHFLKIFTELDFNEKFLLAEKICACKIPQIFVEPDTSAEQDLTSLMFENPVKISEDSGLKKYEMVMDALNFNEELKKITNSVDYLKACEKIISLAELAGEWMISHEFISQICNETREEVHLSFEERVSLMGKIGAVSEKLFEYVTTTESVGGWALKAIREKSEEVFKNNNPEAIKQFWINVHHTLAEQKNNEWIIARISPFDKMFTVEDTVTLVELWSKHGSKAISIINEQMRDPFIKALAEVEPESLRFDFCRKLVASGDILAEKIIKNFVILKIGNMDEEQRDTFFVQIASRGPLAAYELIPHLKKYIKNPEKKLLMYQIIASYPDFESMFALFQCHETFSSENQSFLLNYAIYLTQKGLSVFAGSNYPKLCNDVDVQNKILLEVCVWDKDPSSHIKEILDAPSFLKPFLFKKSTEITLDDMNNLFREIEKMCENEGFKFLKGVLEKIQKQENKMVQAQLLKWYAYVIIQLSKDSDVKIVSSMIPLIFEYQNSSIRFLLTRQLFDVKNICLPSSEKKGLKPKSVEEFSRLLLSRWVELGFSEEQAKMLYTKIENKSSNVFKDTKNSDVLMNFLLNITKWSPFEKNEMLDIVNFVGKILDRKTSKEIVTELQMLNSILNVFGRQEVLSCMKEESSSSAGQFFINKFQEIFPVKVEGDFIEIYQKTFGEFRQPYALFTYLGSVNKLPLYQQQPILKALTTYVEGVLSGKDKFSELRVSTENERYPHLEKIFKSKNGVRESWLEKEKAQILSLGTSNVKYQIGESDDPEDLLLIGTEINGSCQKIDGSPQLNKCLVGYLLNGDMRSIVIKRDGKIVARSLLRLLWDETKKAPVLLQEKIYANFDDPEIEKAINGWAVEKAKNMGISLISKEIRESESLPPYEGQVMFLGGPTPYFYTDAGTDPNDLTSGVKNGHEPFQFTGCHVLFQP